MDRRHAPRSPARGRVGYLARQRADARTASARPQRDLGPRAQRRVQDVLAGACAPPPRGPRPSTVSGIVAAKWLASLAPPRCAADDRAPERPPPRARAAGRSPRARPSRATRARGSRRRASAPPTSAGIAASTRSKASRPVGAHVADELGPSAGTTLNASPACMTVGTAVRWSRAVGVVAAGDRPAPPPASASSALTPVVGRRARVRRSGPSRATSTVPAALRLTTTASLAGARVELAGLEAQARVQAREALDVGEGPGRHSSSQTSSSADLGEVAGAGGERAQDAQGEDVAALHVDRARAEQPVALAAQRLVVVVADDGVEVAEQQDRGALPAPPGTRSEQVGRVVAATSRGRARRRRRRAPAPPRPRRPPPRRGRRPTATRRRRAPRARARSAPRSRRRARRSTGPWVP